MPAIIVHLKCLTNLHVGNGDVNYNIIDNEVERDPVTGYPVINASGVKGALREYFTRNHLHGTDAYFGTDGRNSPDKSTSPGRLKILSAEMLAVPARTSEGNQPFYLISTPCAVNRYCDLKRELLSGADTGTVQEVREAMSVEGVAPAKQTAVSLPDGQETVLYLLEESDFKKISLPVLARNCLNNGISTNLWYEEVVPHESLFYFPVLVDDTPEDRELLSSFRDELDGKVVQFGGNASIGYGLCKITVLSEKEAAQ